MAISIAVIPMVSSVESLLTQTPDIRLVIVSRLLDDFGTHPIGRPHEGVLISAVIARKDTFFVIVALS